MKLHLRDLFWLVALVAVALGWVMDRARLLPLVHHEATKQELLLRELNAKLVEAQWETMQERERADALENATAASTGDKR